MTGGHTNFMQNSTKMKNATDWPIRVALMFTPTPRSFVVSRILENRELLGYLSNERVSEGEEQGDTNADHGYGVEQTGHDEHLDLQHRNHFRLTGSAFQELATQQTEANGGTQGTQTNQQSYGDRGQTYYSFHFSSRLYVVLVKV